MPWFHFTGDFLFEIRPNLRKKYHAGRETNVTTACATAAKAAGKGHEITKPEGMRISKAGEPFVTSTFIHEEAPQEEPAHGEGSFAPTP